MILRSLSRSLNAETVLRLLPASSHTHAAAAAARGYIYRAAAASGDEEEASGGFQRRGASSLQRGQGRKHLQQLQAEDGELGVEIFDAAVASAPLAVHEVSRLASSSRRLQVVTTDTF